MKKQFLSLLYSLCIVVTMHAQVGIGTDSPNPKAALEIKSTDKGVLFPRMTTQQRDQITDPPDGLHIFNTDQHCLNYYDSMYGVWNCYCDNESCRVPFIHITADADSIDFYSIYGKNFPNAKEFVVIIDPGVTINGGIRVTGIQGLYTAYGSRPAVDFSNMPGGVYIKLVNYGNIYGHGGIGGKGATGDDVQYGICLTSSAYNATDGGAGGNAIETGSGITITVENYGLIAGGGGGGGGGGRSDLTQFGGGGGGGAGNPGGPGGQGGGIITQSCGIFGCGPCLPNQLATAGNSGELLTGGTGGAGYNGGGAGGSGGGQGQPGQNGSGTNPGLGGLVGKAIGGGSGNSLTNKDSGQSIGIVD